MLPFEISELQQARDQDLTRMVREQQSNEAITEITNRYTGVYLSVINGFNLPPMIRSDLIDQKNTNIYSYTVGYKEDKGMKLSSFIHQSAYYECLKALHSDTAKHNDELDENAFSESFTYNDEESVKQTSLSIARQVGGRDFEKVVEARHFGDDTAKLSWHHVNVNGKSYEWSRKIYLSNIEKYKEAIKNKFSYVKI